MKTRDYRDLRPVPLRVTAGWRMVINNLVDIRPEDDVEITGMPLGSSKWQFFLDDLLYLNYERFGLDLFVGWFPEGKPQGTYRIELSLCEGGGEPLAQKETRSFEEMIREVERLMSDGTEGRFASG